MSQPVWLRGLIARYGQPDRDDGGQTVTWTGHCWVRVRWHGDMCTAAAWHDGTHAAITTPRPVTDAEVSAVCALAGLYDDPLQDQP